MRLVLAITVGLVAFGLSAPLSSHAVGSWTYEVTNGGLLVTPSADATPSTTFTVYTSAKAGTNAGTAQYSSSYDEIQATVTIDHPQSVRNFVIPYGEPEGLEPGWNMIIYRQSTVVVQKDTFFYVPESPVSIAETLPVAVDTMPDVSLDSSVTIDGPLQVDRLGPLDSDSIAIVAMLAVVSYAVVVSRAFKGRK